MIFRRLTGLVFAGALAFTASAAEIVVRVSPPRMVVQKRERSPGPGYVWVQGYQNWDGRSHVWVPGRWERPPQPRGRWQPHHWVHRRDGWVLVEGHWR
jgi:hypothetical protein